MQTQDISGEWTKQNGDKLQFTATDKTLTVAGARGTNTYTLQQDGTNFIVISPTDGTNARIIRQGDKLILKWSTGYTWTKMYTPTTTTTTTVTNPPAIPQQTTTTTTTASTATSPQPAHAALIAKYGTPVATSETHKCAAAVKALAVGETHWVSRKPAYGDGLDLYYKRLSPADAAKQLVPLSQQSASHNSPVSAQTHGTACPRCGCILVETYRYTSSDGFCGLDHDAWHCADTANCGIMRRCDYEGYGHV
eukprot:TRINITY_DN94069_c0_g1_i1.p1 TRINITY_DN94069_c0_g1~~TRINITY_DN94069_c0_g1_i1.p1  ORF type:complete len:251 (-),score=16.82 TRINITY_DN94069_c0_g1_i1:695-1447(-)